MIKYRFLLSVGYRPIEVHPLFNESLSIDIEKGNGEEYFRRVLNGKLTFVGKDFDWIMDSERSFEQEYILNIWTNNEDGSSQLYWTGTFYRTDCEINYDDKMLSVQPTANDDYESVLGGMDKEYNLIELSPITEKMEIYKSPLLQIYIPNDNVVSCFAHGSSWEQDATQPETESQLESKYHFSLCNIIKEIIVTGISVNKQVDGIYYGTMQSGSERQNYSGTLWREDRKYHIEIYHNGNTVNVRLLDENDSTLYQYQTFARPDFENADFEMQKVFATEEGNVSARMISHNAYARYVCDTETFAGLNTYVIPSDDIVANNRNYKRVIGYKSNIVVSSIRTSGEPTPYGKRDDGRYYLPPSSVTGAKYFPVGRSTWINISTWYIYSLAENIIEETEIYPMTLRVSYPLHSVIKILLEQISPFVHHEPTAEYSQFLYDINPIGNEPLNLFITPKSNILNGDFQTPAQKAPITLGTILQALRNIFQLYWYIEDSKLKIEHIRFFKNGGSYSGSPTVGYDLTEMKNSRNMKPWAFATSAITFDKNKMPERYEFSWADEVTDIFTGTPIEVLSNFVNKGNIESVNIADMNPDIGMMLMNPSAMNPDGFALMSAIYDGKWKIPFVDIPRYGFNIKVQNGYLAMRHIQPKYWVYDLPSWEAEINETSALVRGIKKGKKQEVVFPAGDAEPNPMQLIKTYIGNGKIEKITLNLSSRIIKATLEYDTY